MNIITVVYFVIINIICDCCCHTYRYGTNRSNLIGSRPFHSWYSCTISFFLVGRAVSPFRLRDLSIIFKSLLENDSIISEWKLSIITLSRFMDTLAECFKSCFPYLHFIFFAAAAIFFETDVLRAIVNFFFTYEIKNNIEVFLFLRRLFLFGMCRLCTACT